MFKSMKYFVLLLLIILPIISIFEGSGSRFVGAEDKVEEEDEVIVDTEGEVATDETAKEEEEESQEKRSNEADTIITFIKPAGSGSELPAGKQVDFLVGLKNNGERDFVLDSLSASFRYPMDFSYYIQNFSVITSEKLIKPKQDAAIMYSLIPAEAFAGRPLGLVVMLAYHHADGIDFEEAVFNQTVTITEIDEGLDGETFFLYIFLLAFVILLLLAGHHFLSSFGRKKGETATKKPIIETGTNIKDGIDYDWIPKELLNNYNHSPRQSPKSERQSPRSKDKTRQSPRSRK